jgi:hypothetical protein
VKVPTTDTNVSPGVQTRTNFIAQATGSVSGLMPGTSSSVEVTVSRAVPTLVTQAGPSSVVLGNAVADAATLTAASGVGVPTGTVTFQLYGPNDSSCTGSPVFSSTNALGTVSATSSTATSSTFAPTQAGTYRFTASYSGDANYVPLTGVCNAAGESVTVTAAAAHHPVNDFDGNGTTDVAVFRPADGSWYLRTPTPSVVNWGQSGDIPVPGDYNGDGITDLAVFRPSNNSWYIRTPTPQFVQWGEAGDIPVPGDYDGNGTTDIAVFRPSTGTWYLRTATPTAVVWGQSGDVPAPGDYNGDGTTDIAVFRPSNGAWYLHTPTPQFVQWGQSGDKPLSLPDAIRRFF